MLSTNLNQQQRMDPLEFCYWLQGFAELSNDLQPTAAQWKLIKEHLDLVFHKVTPTLKIDLDNDKSDWRDLKRILEQRGPQCAPERDWRSWEELRKSTGGGPNGQSFPPQRSITIC